MWHFDCATDKAVRVCGCVDVHVHVLSVFGVSYTSTFKNWYLFVNICDSYSGSICYVTDTDPESVIH